MLPPYILVPLLLLGLLASPVVLLCGGLVAKRQRRRRGTAVLAILVTIALWVVTLVVQVGLQMYGHQAYPEWWGQRGGMVWGNFFEVILNIACWVPLGGVLLKELD
ncbi:MAG TPA: hypothetical protein VIQ80_01520 [Candidatus Saccharimonadales bacterium]